jgi:hypothetical protein
MAPPVRFDSSPEVPDSLGPLALGFRNDGWESETLLGGGGRIGYMRGA